ncbi:8-oxo-dGTP diphosphatase [Candidatus Parvarchaeota archaeon]|jgi:8-oxo-dGTP pyrophosphatase MutT (NUDIX family)|nr:8-oxo-dGTP diphosphatase [Candidatus Parvarchaeota archaeon]
MAELKDQNLKHYIENYVNLRNVTLCYLFDKKADRVLLAMKKRGFGAGKLNGVGGKVEKAESIEDALLRETREEINVNLKKFEKVAVINFYFKNNPIEKDFNQKAHVFIAYEWEGEPAESEEMAPQWVNTKGLPFENMWSDDIYWLPNILSGKKLIASFLFDNENNIVDMDIKEVKSF